MNKKIIVFSGIAVILAFIVVFYVNLGGNKVGSDEGFTMEIKEGDSENKEVSTSDTPKKVGSLRVNAGSVESVEIISS